MAQPMIYKNLGIPLPLWERITALEIKNVNAWIVQAIEDKLTEKAWQEAIIEKNEKEN